MATKVGVQNNKQKSRRQAHNRANGYYARQALRTIANRKRKQLKHFKQHPNHIKGVEKLRESLGLS